MKKNEMRLLVELIKNSCRSDRKLAKVLGTSQPTVTRMRNRLVKEGVIQQFTVIPDFVKMGFEIVAVTLTKTKFEPKLRERLKKSAMEKPNIIFCAGCEGLGKNRICISFHKDYADYYDFITKYMTEWRDVIESYETVLISMPGTIVKPLSLKYLTELFEE
jgi:DNA-binding Lrp family transcriptional regulator